MRHIIFGGDGFVGRHLAPKLVADGQDVIVADIVKSDLSHYRSVKHVHCDVTDAASVAAVGIKADDMVYNLSAKMLSPIQVRAKRHDFFFPVNYHGTVNIIEAMDKAGAPKLVHFTTDMIYGHTVTYPMTEEHPVSPLGEYGLSKWRTEELAADWRQRGMSISLFRPRLIIGPGRLGILEKLFKLIDWNLPVPMIGSGKNPYQFISVFDCAEACRAAWKAGVPNEAYNLGSLNPPPVRKLLGDLIKHAGSKSILVPTPGWAVKRTLDLLDWMNMPIMDPEQYLIADEECVLDVSKAKRQLGWAPQYRDEDMLIAAYKEYRAKKDGHAVATSHVPAE
ncbi:MULTISPECIES: NAD(P)-dependent oxidoreductase [unclassified Mesorhizobium]|uniref:NAD-dependent epimerase/dehydratase family protein n=1 Tax=unclassified Mesorhizobium TaxID=325217 RepID=UPI0006FAA717|nr:MULTISPECIES: NAD(P)-dependent oxidoreductase [unclassified Mesorhizobium]KQZ13878.1 NAD-dependent dehydratase [Mesorhizobium sp. Root1471]KQZ36390.1 NAD-dependent dehydratase [Mesorhizobium sp. Root554]MDR7032879.1 dTDP-glucose 4,6-dehydratase [Mesorhizobium sp. BE184]